MLPAPHRLTKEKDFHQIKIAGKSFFSPYLRLRLVGNQLSVSRFAVVVSSRVSKKAVQRNRLKRQLRAIIGAQLGRVASGADVMISPNRQALELSYQLLTEELLKLFRKARLL